MSAAASPDRRDRSDPSRADAIDPTSVSDAAIEAGIFELLAHRAAGASICPSEVARAVAPPAQPWRTLMPEVRRVAGSLAAAGRFAVTRAGVPVDAESRGGPFRLALSHATAGKPAVRKRRE